MSHPSFAVAATASSTAGPTLGAFMTDANGAVWYSASTTTDEAPVFSSSWFPLGGEVVGDLVACRNITNTFTVFAINKEGELSYCYQDPTVGWLNSKWISLGISNCVGTPAIVSDADGLLYVFVRTKTEQQYGLSWTWESGINEWQDGQDGGNEIPAWYKSTKLAHVAASLFTIDGDSAISVCASDGGNYLYTLAGVFMDDGTITWEDWTPLENPTIAAEISPPCMSTTDNVVSIFAVRVPPSNWILSTQAFAQTFPAGDIWASWNGLVDLSSIKAVNVPPVMRINTSVEPSPIVFFKDAADTLSYAYQTPSSTGWSTLNSLPLPLLVGCAAGPFVVQNPNAYPDGGNGLVVFIIGSDAKVYYTYQDTAGLPSSWASPWIPFPAAEGEAAATTTEAAG